MIKIKIGPAEIGIAVVTLMVAGVVGYQFADIKDSQDGALASTDQTEEAKQEAEVVAKEQENKEVDVPEQESTEAKIKEQESQAPEAASEPEEIESEDVRVSVSASQRGSLVDTTASLSQPITGTCYIKFEKSGYTMAPKLVTVSNSTSCTASMSRTEFGSKGTWDVHVKFVSLDKKLEGEAETKVVIN